MPRLNNRAKHEDKNYGEIDPDTTIFDLTQSTRTANFFEEYEILTVGEFLQREQEFPNSTDVNKTTAVNNLRNALRNKKPMPKNPKDPSPEEIARMTKEIQDNWNETTRESRFVGNEKREMTVLEAHVSGEIRNRNHF